MSKSSNFLFYLTFILILLSTSSGAGHGGRIERGGQGQPSDSRHDGARGVGAGVIGANEVGSSSRSAHGETSSLNIQRVREELIREYTASKDVTKYIECFNCFVNMQELTQKKLDKTINIPEEVFNY
ncbi:unnamed protein product [Meloidogyne enterolobii]|uniref:Uncharacterized protein n=1 Tax=Meloidogyne enterolobii TaxID=390850 RepID=A0ACB0ZMZ2_MELEN